MKSFSTVRDTWRGSQSNMEMRRGKWEIEVNREIEIEEEEIEIEIKDSKGERESYPIINSLCTLHSLDPSELFTELHREEKREEGDRGDQKKKRGNQNERDRPSQ